MLRRFFSSRFAAVIDQGLSSVSNMLASVSVAHYSTREEFGSFGVAFAVYLASLNIGRGFVGDVAILRLPGVKEDRAGEQTRSAAAVAILYGASVGALLVCVGAIVQGTTGALLATLGAAMPILMLQDALRFICFADRKPFAALANDAAWFAVQLALVLVMTSMWHPSAVAMFAAWAFASACGAVVGIVLLRLRPWFGGARAWLAEHGSLIRSLLTEQAFISGSAQGSPLAVGWVSGVSAVGGLRAAQTAFGPLTVFNTGLSLAAVPSASARWVSGDRRFYRPLILNGAIVVVFSLLWGVALFLAPMSWGRLLLGENWDSVHDLCFVTGVWLAFSFSCAPAISALRIVGRQWWSAIARMVFAPMVLIGAACGAVMDGPFGATIGLAVATAASSAGLWLLFGRTLRTQHRRAEQEGAGGTVLSPPPAGNRY